MEDKNRILLVDDETEIVKMVQEVLDHLGYRITGYTNSIDALEQFQSHPDQFDLIITDMTMPNMTGAELSSRILELRPDMPIIICTGFSDMIDEKKAKTLGIKEYMIKPIKKGDLDRVIRNVLDC